jgi:molybdopterin converting factor subunit 1
MNVQVRLFARARDLAGQDLIQLDVPSGGTVGDLRRYLAAAYPALGAILPRCALALEDQFAGDDVPLVMNTEVALLPPVSGG